MRLRCIGLIGVFVLLTACSQQHESSPEVASSMVVALQTAPGLYRQPRWSHDSQAIGVIFAGEGATPPFIVTVLDSAGQRTHSITSDQYSPDNAFAWPETLAWHPDGSLWIAVDLETQQELRQGLLEDRDALAQWRADGPTAAITLTQQRLPPIMGMAWSPDGSTLLAEQKVGTRVRSSDLRPTGITAFSTAPSTWVQWQVHDTLLSHPRWSPAGDAVVYVASTAPGKILPVESELVVRSWDTQSVQRFTPEAGCSYIEPSWSPDGTYLLYREVCNNSRRKRVDHLMIASYPAFDRQMEVCDGMALAEPDWGIHGNVIAVTIGVPGKNTLVVCTINLP
jgi:hypothetical protein